MNWIVVNLLIAGPDGAAQLGDIRKVHEFEGILPAHLRSHSCVAEDYCDLFVLVII